jgi:hypothetical protein
VFTLTGQRGSYGIKSGSAPLPKLPVGSGG